MMTLQQISAAAAALGNQVMAGIPLDQAISRMTQLQPAYSEFWLRAMQNVRSGRMLSDSLAEVWPDSLVSAIRAGEQSGKLESVLARVEETIELQMSIRGKMMRLLYPFAMGLMGLGVFLVFMIVILPMMAKSLDTRGSRSFIFHLSEWMSGFFHDNWMMTAIAVSVGIVALTSWLKTPEAKNVLMDFCLTIPFIREALRDMYFGLWARYMALMVEAGIPTATALSVTAPVLPGTLQESVLAFERDLTDNRSLSDAADPAKLKEGDARSTWWPFYISNAFVIAEQTGTIDRELLRVAPALIKEGVRKLDVALWIGQVVALAVSGLLIVSPLAAYYNEVFAALKNAGH